MVFLELLIREDWLYSGFLINETLKVIRIYNEDCHI